MSLLQAIALGIVQGLTEFLPISSTAHLLIVPRLLGWDDPSLPTAAFSAVIQIGTLAAVLAYFWRDIVRIAVAVVSGVMRGRPLDTPDARLGWMIAVATIPIVVCGLLFEKHIESTLRSLYVVAAMMIVLALVLAIAEYYLQRRTRRGLPLNDINGATWRDAVAIGIAQALALVPGTSRSGATITAGLFCGFSREAAARFSFLCSLPSIFAAGVYELYKEREALFATQGDATNLVVATIVSGVVGYWSIGFLLRLLRTRTTLPFIVYRLALGALLLALLAGGTLKS